MMAYVRRFLSILFIFIQLFLTHLLQGLPAGTPVLTKQGLVAIEQLRVGQSVISFDLEKEKVMDVQIAAIATTKVREVIIIKTTHGIITSSPEQLFCELVCGDFKRAGDIKRGNLLLTKTKEECFCEEVATCEIPEAIMYNVSLHKQPLFFATPAQVLIHNCCAAQGTALAFCQFCGTTPCLLIPRKPLSVNWIREPERRFPALKPPPQKPIILRGVQLPGEAVSNAVQQGKKEYEKAITRAKSVDDMLAISREYEALARKHLARAREECDKHEARKYLYMRDYCIFGHKRIADKLHEQWCNSFNALREAQGNVVRAEQAVKKDRELKEQQVAEAREREEALKQEQTRKEEEKKKADEERKRQEEERKKKEEENGRKRKRRRIPPVPPGGPRGSEPNPEKDDKDKELRARAEVRRQ